MNYETPEVQEQLRLIGYDIQHGRDPFAIDTTTFDYHQKLIEERGINFATEVYDTAHKAYLDAIKEQNLCSDHEMIMIEEGLITPTPDEWASAKEFFQNEPTSEFRNQNSL